MTAINSNRAIRGPVTALPFVAGTGVRLVADTANNRIVVEADETVLFSNASGEPGSNMSITLSEPLTNFERIRFYWQAFNSRGRNHKITEIMADGIQDITLEAGIFNTATTSGYNIIWELLLSNDTTLSTFGCKYHSWNTGSVNDGISFVALYKVVGINRIASN